VGGGGVGVIGFRQSRRSAEKGDLPFIELGTIKEFPPNRNVGQVTQNGGTKGQENWEGKRGGKPGGETLR